VRDAVDTGERLRYAGHRMSIDPIVDDALWEAFTACTLPADAWKHRTHLRVAFLHLARWTLDEAHLRMRVGIIRLNAAQGLVETAERGYHETLTRAWLSCVSSLRADDARCGRPADGSVPFCAAHPEIFDKTFLLRFYSRERLLSLEARSVFVPPDLAALPR
jgi:hypothetical protein